MAKDILCLWWGEKSQYNIEYVAKLRSMIDRNTTQRHRLFCLTQNPERVDIHGVIPYRIPEDGLWGFWNKMYLYDILPVGDDVAFFDLDTVFTGNIDHILAYNPIYGVLEDFRNRKPYFGSGVILYKPTWMSYLYDRFMEAYDKGINPDDYKGREDVWIKEHLDHVVPTFITDTFPGQIVSFKDDLDRGRIEPDENVRIVCFHGVPKPHHVNRGWVARYWY